METRSRTAALAKAMTKRHHAAGLDQPESCHLNMITSMFCSCGSSRAVGMTALLRDLTEEDAWRNGRIQQSLGV
ncbi:hypothetical protein AMK24_11350 [Streptomyces sp. CB02366]|nr:hypothetical protein AMK24_11350 [Streptomyces sp. CB02366]